MKPRYNLRIQSSKPILSKPNKKPSSIPSSRVAKQIKPRRPNPVINQETRRHSLRLTPHAKETGSQVPKWRKIENDNEDENSSIDNDNDDDYDDLVARHQRIMLDEQKDRKLYERYIRDQRTLRRLQCRRTHSGHLKEATRNRLLRELERERRYKIQDKICTYLANHRIIFRHGRIKQPMTWSSLEEEMPDNRNIGTIHELDVMINNLKKVVRNSNTSISKPRLSVRERQNQRLASITPVTPTKSDISQTTEMKSTSVISNSMMNLPPHISLISLSPRVPIVRFIDNQNNKLRTSNSQHLTCIQNVLSHQNRTTTNEASTPSSSRKSFLRQKPTHTSESSAPKKRALEKENCSILPTTDSNTVLQSSSPMVSIKHTASSSSSRTYPNTRQHLMINNSFSTRRKTRLSMNV